MKRWRTLMKMSQARAAELLGYSAYHILRMEKHGHSISIVCRLAMQYLYECKKNGVKPKLWGDER